MKRQQAEELLEKYRSGTCTLAEQAQVELWLMQYGETGSRISEIHLQQLSREVRQKLPIIGKKPFILFPGYWAAAILIAALATALYFIAGSRKPEAGSIAATEILPGYNQATLTLADGTKINLDSAKSGIQIRDEDISYNDGSKLSAVVLSEAEASRKPDEAHSTHSAPGGSAQGDALLQLSTPKGGQYQIILSDGTKVWLNAASTLKYPSRFSGDTRTVEINGEGYFEIKEDKTKPFKVLSKNQEILVLGTSFNINSYDPIIKTTLISGAIQVATFVSEPKRSSSRGSYTQQLDPGEQSTVQSNGNINKTKVDVTRELSWRSGKFSFDNKSFTRIMDEMARWYNFEPIYEGTIPSGDLGLIGGAFRTDKLSTVLRFLENVGFDYRIETDANNHRLVIIHKKGEQP